MSQGSRGFSLIEMVITMALVALIASMALPMTETVIRRGHEQELRTALYQLRDAIDAYKMAATAGHIQTAANESGYPPSLQILVEGVRDVRDVKGGKIYFLRRIPRDPFADQQRQVTEHWGLRAYDSPAEDPRSGDDVFDVYSLARGQGLNGVPYRAW
ncbi:general secretion pathway protein GspG [Oceanisphaera profunda]|uniref:General secretion pathway protein GspG n=1 Tax=Oceanisphaera profunda TaxID=1416627 RepID=A0A1Y0D6G9_9GAMM|nr:MULTISPECIES: type II secretion system protein [Oceanisphaera]ART83120.1 general secretion pathway protein GspG [Oceanisphaera profunda]